MVNKHYVEVKSIKKNTGLPDTYFVSKFGFSPYKACQHGCKYCDGRSEKYYIDGDFEKDITVRKNIPSVLETSLRKFREKGIIGISSGVSDPYQPIEIKERLMPQCAEIISRYKYPAMLFTKSNMVMRDIDLWEEVHKKAGFTLMMSIVYPNDDIRKHFEPYSSSVEQRLKTLKAFKDRGMSVGVLAMPLLPFLTDSAGQMDQMMKNYDEIGVDVVMPGCMTLRPGINKKTYFDIIDKHYPHLKNQYFDLYSENRQSGSPRKWYAEKVHKQFSRIIYKHGTPEYIPHRLYKNRMPIYDEIYILMTHMIKLYDKRRVNVDSLVLARKRYGAWLTDEKTYYNRRRNLSFDELESKVINMLDNGTMMTYFQNEKLLNFFKKVVLDQQVFNYITLKLEAL
ncbi:radical SAM protein [Acidaminobacter sp. JC074]|uniref:SPL family radical SAM protein n=1 Tax=Acidaminobacter sp. JC074 TaxID=2530199 RepID=UPI001F103B77|nr:radical SAM protein [Acidaminobacter sp. JC074]